MRNAASKIFGSQAGKGGKKNLLQSTLTLIHHLTHQNHSNRSATAGCLNHPLASLQTTSPLSIPSSLFLLLFLSPPLTFAFSTLFSSFLYFVPPPPLFCLVFLFSLRPPPLLNPVCYPSSPCRQKRSLTTDSLLPFLLPNQYTTSRYWLHAELLGPRPPLFPLAFPAAFPL